MTRSKTLISPQCTQRRRLGGVMNRRTSAKKALKLESLAMGKVSATPLPRSKKNLKSYSPTTGTCPISPFSTPRSNNVQEHGNGLSNGNREKRSNLLIRSPRRGHPEMEDYEKLLILQSEVEDSVARFMKIRQNLTNLQALEGTRELENIIGVSETAGNLKGEVRKTRKLIKQAGKLLRRTNARQAAQDGMSHYHHMTISNLPTALSTLSPSSTEAISEEYILLGCKILQLPDPT
ncbi:centromere protein R isoform X4 [Podarcis raffonei]|uniref:centromere protein R isoform X4 n=2 Tax=Podarcis raffonei TaxID=65483 RepID=UPI0023298346|nr:centromere protein R isoform X4 [Podarcis raffonei]